MSKKITLTSTDGDSFEIDEAIALQSQTIAHLLEENVCTKNGVPLPNVKSNILAMVIEYCKKHVDGDSLFDEDLKKWDTEFMKMINDQSALFDLIEAANYLNIKSLFDLTCQTVADVIASKTPDEIRAFFNIESDFTVPEEEEQVRRENRWAFD